MEAHPLPLLVPQLLVQVQCLVRCLQSGCSCSAAATVPHAVYAVLLEQRHRLQFLLPVRSEERARLGRELQRLRLALVPLSSVADLRAGEPHLRLPDRVARLLEARQLLLGHGVGLLEVLAAAVHLNHDAHRVGDAVLFARLPEEAQGVRRGSQGRLVLAFGEALLGHGEKRRRLPLLGCQGLVVGLRAVALCQAVGRLQRARRSTRGVLVLPGMGFGAGRGGGVSRRCGVAFIRGLEELPPHRCHATPAWKICGV
mmetsp:Transcript_114312/g.323793  ORF Transcript_114312/g.323793 Transcript_114312/m.323793 type:complete len:256 (+) Transcript_114312:1755-2522(+)